MRIDIKAEVKFTASEKDVYLVRLQDTDRTIIGSVRRTSSGWNAYDLDDRPHGGNGSTRYMAAAHVLEAYELGNGLRDSEGNRVTKDPETNLWFVADFTGARRSSRWTDKADAIAKLASLQPQTDWEAVGRQAALGDKPAAPAVNADVRYALAGRPVGDPENVRIMEAFSKGYQAVRDEQGDEVLSDARKAADDAIDTQRCIEAGVHLIASRHTRDLCPAEEINDQRRKAEAEAAEKAAEILTVADATSLSAIIEAAIHCRKVARVIDGLAFVGEARSIGDVNGNFLHGTTDVRDAYLRVTLLQGFEAFWPVRELVAQHQADEFIAWYKEA